MRTYTYTTILLAFVFQGLSQTDSHLFLIAYKEGNLRKMDSVLTQWTIRNPKDPELIISEFNYRLYKAESTEFVETLGSKSKEDLVFVSPDGSMNLFLEKRSVFDPMEIFKAEKILVDGITKFPDRLDFRYGLLILYQKTEKWTSFVDAVIATLQQSVANSNNWRWVNNKVFEGAAVGFLNGLDDFQGQLFETNKDELLPYFRVVAEEIKKIYPDHLQSYYDISISHLLLDQFEPAVAVLLEAEKRFPTEKKLIANLAYAYKMSGNSELAIVYYNKLKECGDSEDKVFAKKAISLLEN